MHILVTSPIPSHPQNHGNRARVTTLCKKLQDHGGIIHFVYGGLEELPPEQEQAMRMQWDHVHVLPPFLMSQRKKSHRRHYLIDDWYAEEVTALTARILDTWNISYCLANYVWFSKWLEEVPAGIPKYIDTHDLFGGRHKKLEADGHEITWFYTSPDEEGRGFGRADKIIAIQSSEAETMQKRTDVPVVTLGHFVEPHFLPPAQPAASGKVTVGFMASDNPINEQSLILLNDAIRKRPSLLERYSFVLAGAICRCAGAEAGHFKRMGFVDTLEDFYRSVDLVINPNIGGTGLKIKSVEALAHGKAMVATSDAMTGLTSSYPLHKMADADAICDALMALEAEREIPAAETAARTVINDYNELQDKALRDLFPALFDQEEEAAN